MILWVRHGESTWNAAGRLQGAELGPPLTARGREQAAAVADELAGRGVTRLLTSPAVRARQTAETISGRLALDPTVEPLLLERGLDETVPAVLDRVRSVVSRDDAGTTVAVSHGDVIALAIALLAGAPPAAPANASIHAVDPVSKQASIWLP